MSPVLQFLGAQGGWLLVGATCVLALGCSAVLVQRAPVHRQRTAELTVVAVLVLLVLSCLPLPRAVFWEGSPASANNTRVPSAGSFPALPASTWEPAASQEDQRVEVETPWSRSGASGTSRAAATVELPPASPAPPSAEPLDAPVPEERTAVVAAPAPLPARFDLRLWLPALYAAGGLACLAWLTLGRLLVFRIIRWASPPAPWLERLYAGLPFADQRRPRLLISRRSTQAWSYGLWRSTIVLPESACRPERAGALGQVLAHELAHVRRRDAWGHLLFNAAFPVLYFHPLYWWLRRRARLAAELIADDCAARRQGKQSYVEALVTLVKERGLRRSVGLSVPGVFGSHSQFYRRMQMLLERKTGLTSQCSPRWRMVYPAVFIVAVGLAAAVVGVQPGNAQEPTAALEAAAPLTALQPSDAQEPTAALEAAAPTALQKDLAELERQSVAVLLAHRLKLEYLDAEKAKLEARVERTRDQLEAMAEEKGVLESQYGAEHPKQLELKRRQEVAEKQLIELLKELEVLMVQKSVLSRDPAAAQQQAARRDLERARAQIEAAKAAAAKAAAAKAAQEKALRARQEALLEARAATRLQQAQQAVLESALARPQYMSGGPASEGSPFDLVNLATAFVEAVGELEAAKATYANYERLREANAVSQKETTLAEIRVRTAERKVALLEQIAKSAAKAIEVEVTMLQREMSRLQEMSRLGKQTGQAASEGALRIRMARAESRLEILHVILQTGR
ncbi:MAG: M56 family metallopeptidase [Planctomycetota bacterium]|jgi:beta-lactamase regulating signal transducer with metallopeptidase domain